MAKERLEEIILYQLSNEFIPITWQPLPRNILEEGGNLNKLTVLDDSILSKAHIIEDISNKYQDIKEISMHDMLLAHQTLVKIVQNFVIPVANMKQMYDLISIIDDIRKTINEKTKELYLEYNEASEYKYISLNYDIIYGKKLTLNEVYENINNITKEVFNINIGTNVHETEVVMPIKSDIINKGYMAIMLDETKNILYLNIWVSKTDYSFEKFVSQIDKVFETKQILYLYTKLH